MSDIPLPTDPFVQPVEYVEGACGIAIRATQLVEAGEAVAQHKHEKDHATFLSSGAVRVWVDNKWTADYVAPALFVIQAGHLHLFQALQPNTHLACLFRDDDDKRS